MINKYKNIKYKIISSIILLSYLLCQEATFPNPPRYLNVSATQPIYSEDDLTMNLSWVRPLDNFDLIVYFHNVDDHINHLL